MKADKSVSADKVVFVSLLLLLSIISVGCRKSNKVKKAEEVYPGEYYSFRIDDGRYKVLKVLIAEEELIHVCYYNNLFKEKPTKAVIQFLYFGNKKHKLFGDALLSEEGGQITTGRKHIALTLQNWQHWEPNLLTNGEVTPDELKAYEEWKNGDRYVSGNLIIPTH